ncbi:MAG: hypothetical protein ACFCVD_19710 [Nodosilinea sp.]
MQSWPTSTPEDRLESLKAATISGTGAGLMAATILLAHRVQAVGWSAALGSTLGGLGGWAFGVSIAIAALSGSLFGITYRYAVRQDPNPQIKVGVILAFTLVRGLALINVAAALSLGGWPFLTATLESLLMFTTAGGLLEIALQRRWIKSLG